MIILEGPDGSGKSTLANQLSAALNVAVHHSGGPPRSPEEIIERQVRMNDSLRRGVVTIYDRAPCISDPIYGPIIRGGTPFTDHPYLAPEMRVRLKVPVIYCRPNHFILHAAVQQRKEENKPYKPAEHVAGVRQNVDAIIHTYDWLIGDFPHWRFDWTGSSESPTFDQLVYRIRERLLVPELVM